MVSYGWCLLIQGYSCAVYNSAEKAELSKRFRYPKRKLGVTMHFSEIIKLQFGKKNKQKQKKKRHTLLCILLLFRIIVAYLSLKKCVVTPQFSFWISKALAKICFSSIVINGLTFAKKIMLLNFSRLESNKEGVNKSRTPQSP